MILNSRNNLFSFKLPRNFIPEEVAQKYVKYLNRIPGTLMQDPIDYVNYSIQGINLPGLSFDPISQADNDGTTRYHRGAIPIQNTVERQFTLTFQLLDGYVNYWIMLDTLLYYYARSTKQPFTEDLVLRIMDAEGIGMASVAFEKPIMNSINELNLNFSENVADFSTFEVNFYYNKFNLKLEID